MDYAEGIRAVRLINDRFIDAGDMNELNLQVEEELDARDEEELMFKAFKNE